MLFSGYNSLFFIEMSEKRGLFYDISGYTEKYRNIGELSFSFEVRPGMVYDAVETAISLLSRFKATIPDENAMMKASYVTNSPLLYDSASELNFAFAYDNHIMNEGYRSVEDRARRYSEVTPSRIKEVASIIFRPENLTLTLKGNKKKIDVSRLEEMVKKL
jgi:predicted Zn-dependent peptidase